MKKSKIALIVLSCLTAITLATTIIFTIKFVKEKQKKDDIIELVAYHFNMNELTDHIYDISISLENELYDYVFNSKYSSYDEVIEKVRENNSNKLSVIDFYYDTTKRYYNSIKTNNYYYIKDNEIQESVETIYNNVKEYYNFILPNKDLNYIQLTLQNEPAYKNCKSSLDLLSAKIMSLNNRKEINNLIQK